ncbi:MAG: Crp/Fnr family transcriptional regulator [Lachnospiraceae bacterium]|nr:Crp/Fnr family transcriptional regulator [Lachnospiraceae bacterium]MDD7051208.1 Crp/Fnr family transcriptional regulator [Lachnospiraceae bacterium]MDY4095652.1 Crp/Fnr family transcriptional regulator [Lachnospiraceae bacterium]
MDYSILEKCVLFVSISPNDLPHLLTCIEARKKSFLTGEYLWLADEQVNHLGIVLSGSLELVKENPAGIKHILDFVGPGQLFGEGIVCTKMRLSPVTVRARENSDILFLPFTRIIRACEHSCGFHHQIIHNMLMLLGEKNRILNRKIELLALKGMREKLATYLLYEADKQNSQSFTIIPNRNELAEYLNVSRSSMCRELGRMKELGMIDYYQNSFKILSKEALTRCLL